MYRSRRSLTLIGLFLALEESPARLFIEGVDL
jgi:hypothetical protein